MFGLASLLMALAVSGSPMSPPGPDRETRRVEVNGKRYRVVTQGGTVLVANKSFVVQHSLSERDDQRAAVRAATGCGVVDELPTDDGRLRGKLACEK